MLEYHLVERKGTNIYQDISDFSSLELHKSILWVIYTQQPKVNICLGGPLHKINVFLLKEHQISLPSAKLCPSVLEIEVMGMKDSSVTDNRQHH